MTKIMRNKSRQHTHDNNFPFEHKISMLNFLLWVREWRWVIPTAGIVGPAPAYYTVSLAIRALKPFVSATTLTRLDDAAYDSYQSLILFFMETTSGVRISLHGDVEECVARRKENVLFLSNHQSTMDWAVADMLAVRCASLGHLRYVLKAELQFLPLYGWYFWLHGCVYVRRAGSFKAQRTATQLRHLAQVPPFSWLVLFPEGTRFGDPESLLKSRKYAASLGFEPLNHVLFPRFRGAQMALQALGSKVDAIYDTTIAYSQARTADGSQTRGPSIFQFATAPTGSRLDIHVRRWELASVPTDDEGLQRWLYERFAEKDRLLDSFYAGPDGRLPEEVEEDSAVSPWRTGAALAFWWGLSLPFYATATGRRIAAAIFLPCSVLNILYVRAIKAV